MSNLSNFLRAQALKDWIRDVDANQRNYCLGLVLLLVGLSWGVSVATALTVVGAVLIGESVITSYMAQWIKAIQARNS